MKPPPAEGGFALLLVLWTLIPISLMFIGLTLAARSEAQLAANLRGAAELEALADGAIYTAVFDRMARGGPAGNSLVVTAGDAGVQVSVEVRSQSGLVNPNVAPAGLLRALMVQLGSDLSQASAVAAGIVDWRTSVRSRGPSGPKAQPYLAAGLDHGPPGAPFETLEELGEVLGMTPDLLAALMPYLTLYWDGNPDPAAAGAVVQGAMRDARITGSRGPANAQVIGVTATAQRSDGTQAARHAIVRIGPSPNLRGWRVLAWGAGQGG